MQQIILNVEDNKADLILKIINSLKSDLIKSCITQKVDEDNKAYMQLSAETLSKIWDTKEDSAYDRFLK